MVGLADLGGLFLQKLFHNSVTYIDIITVLLNYFLHRMKPWLAPARPGSSESNPLSLQHPMQLLESAMEPGTSNVTTSREPRTAPGRQRQGFSSALEALDT